MAGMLGRLLIIAVALGPVPRPRIDPAEDAYQSARVAYRALKADPIRRKFRHQWLKVAHRFDQVFQNYHKSRRAADSLLAAAELYEELSQISRVNDDLLAATGDYQHLMEAFPRTAQGDRASLGLAKIQLERMGDPASARRTLERQLKRHPSGDRAIKVMLSEVRKSMVARATKKPEVPNHAIAQQVVRDGPGHLVEQLSLKIRRVVIDPGHGGHDTGAIGHSGTREKEVALRIAKRLAHLLTLSGLEVVLTRDSDEFVPLDDRTRRANEARGDLFVSIHCNSARNRKLRGIETYTLNTSSDRYSIRLAARENSASEKGISDLQFILADLATKANTEESLRLASRLQQTLVSRLSAKYRGIENLGTKEALFYVLLGVRMPAVLVETSFLSQAEEERRLASKQYQEDIARALAAGIHDFLDDRQRVAAKVQ